MLKKIQYRQNEFMNYRTLSHRMPHAGGRSRLRQEDVSIQ